MSNKGKHIYYANAKGIVGLYEEHFYTSYFAKNDEEAINIAKSKLNECTGQINIDLYDIVIENKKHNKIN